MEIEGAKDERSASTSFAAAAVVSGSKSVDKQRQGE